MNRVEKIQFINELIESTREEILSKVDKMPKEWDGIELREYIVEKFKDCVYMSKSQRMTTYKKRLREYRNTVLDKNL